MKKIFTFLLLSCFIIATGSINAQDNKQIDKAFAELKVKGEIYFSFSIPNINTIEEIGRIVSIDNVVKGKELRIFAYSNLSEFNDFLKLDIDFQLEKHPGSLIKNPKMLLDPTHKDISSWDFYPSYSAYVAMMYQFETTYPGLCEIISIGQSVNGKELLYAKISDNVDSLEAEPRINYTATMHGDETVGYVLMLRMIDYLLTNYGTDAQVTNLVSNAEIWINPLANPDGTFMGGNNTVSGAIRYNANYIDLNRNYADFDDGPHPDGNAWQTETVAFMDFADSIEFVLGTNIHGGAELVNYPWD
ncbi:MAG: M14 family zinc carboxypeptidase, partial [Bacteroidota bacterium]|nr:M14 family zinc carboxypeptidase [Bacteroidota bacterium]